MQQFRYLKAAHVPSDLHLSAFSPVSSRSFTNLISFHTIFLKSRCQPECSRAILMISLLYSPLNALLVDIALSLHIELQFNKSHLFCMYQPFCPHLPGGCFLKASLLIFTKIYVLQDIILAFESFRILTLIQNIFCPIQLMVISRTETCTVCLDSHLSKGRCV